MHFRVGGMVSVPWICVVDTGVEWHHIRKLLDIFGVAIGDSPDISRTATIGRLWKKQKKNSSDSSQSLTYESLILLRLRNLRHCAQKFHCLV